MQINAKIEGQVATKIEKKSGKSKTKLGGPK